MIRDGKTISRIENAMRISTVLLLTCSYPLAGAAPPAGNGLRVKINSADGSYSIGMQGTDAFALQATVGVEVGGHWLHASDYPRHTVEKSQVNGYLGQATDWQVTYSGISGRPDLIYHLVAYSEKPFGDIQVTVRNTTGKIIHIESIRSLEATSDPVIDLSGPSVQDRVLSDSVSENRPDIRVRNLADAEQLMHRGVGSQLIYNRKSHQSLFLGALTSDKFLTILRLHLSGSAGGNVHPAAYEVDSTGTTELGKLYSLKQSPPDDQIELNLPLAPGAELSSERLLVSVSTDYHRQLETYGSLIREIHHARTTAPPLMGWWSWTAYYFGLNGGAALTNAEWEAEHLKSLGYNVFHIDEGYQYARGEYQTANAALFPHGMASLYYKVHGLGLVPAIWTAPFEVSERSWVYQHHPDWLVKNAKGQPIQIGYVVDKIERIFVLDPTNPGAQAYLRETYSTLVHEWGLRYIKLDFMDDTAVEGYYYKPHTTALEAQRIGLQIIRQTVGNDVYLDKDGSPMLNPVGYVDYGRTSEDTGHSFQASKRSASGICARYYMNRNFFVADPDAFTVSTETVANYSHRKNSPASLGDAQVSIALAAISGGMFEIGDDLSLLSREPERLTLIENPDLIDMIRLGQASVPLDLMSFSDGDEQPSIFLLRESRRQSILTVFNWTDSAKNRSVNLADVTLPGTGQYSITDVLDDKNVPSAVAGVVAFSQPPHSVRVLKIIDTQVSAEAPVIASVDHPDEGDTGDTLRFAAQAGDQNPVLHYSWDFGDGVSLPGRNVTHVYTQPGEYSVILKADGLSGLSTEDRFKVRITGHMSSTFEPQRIKRYE